MYQYYVLLMYTYDIYIHSPKNAPFYTNMHIRTWPRIYQIINHQNFSNIPENFFPPKLLAIQYCTSTFIYSRIILKLNTKGKIHVHAHCIIHACQINLAFLYTSLRTHTHYTHKIVYTLHTQNSIHML